MELKKKLYKITEFPDFINLTNKARKSHLYAVIDEVITQRQNSTDFNFKKECTDLIELIYTKLKKEEINLYTVEEIDKRLYEIRRLSKLQKDFEE